MNTKLKKIAKVFLISSFATVLTVFLLNAGIIYGTQPANIQKGETTKVSNTFGSVSIIGVESLQSGGLGLFGWSAETTGYVNIFEEEPNIYIDAQVSDNVYQSSTLYRHELAHVLQKQMIAHETGGYPSVWNPVLSIRFYVNAIRLNNDLKKVMPETNEGTLWLSEGLESAADCYAQPNSSLKDEPTFYVGSYLEEGFCTAEQARLAKTLMTTDKWFGPLDQEKLDALEPVNITTEPIEENNFDSVTNSIEEMYNQILKQTEIKE